MARPDSGLLAGLLAGALVGASLAMLLAPPAPTTRDRLRAKARDAALSKM